MRILFLFSLILTGSFAFSQNEALRHSTDEEYNYDFHIYLKDKEVKFEDTLTYFWFKAQKIYSSQGNAGGHVLDGPFTAFHKNGQVAEKGEFDEGLKDGVWKTWRNDGTLKSIYTYDEGCLDGEYSEYNETGQQIEKGKYKKGEIQANKANTDENETEKKSSFLTKHFTKKTSEEKTAKAEERREKKAAKLKKKEAQRSNKETKETDPKPNESAKDSKKKAEKE